MARVPVYQGGQVLPEIRPGVQVQSPLSMEAASLPGRNAQTLAQGLGAVSSELGRVAEVEQDKINKVRFNDAYNEALSEAARLKSEYTQLKAAEAVKGVDGRPLAAYYDEKLKEAIDRIGSDLTAPDLRQGFGLAASDLQSRFMIDAESYEVEQGAAYAEQVRDSTIVRSFDEIATSPSSPVATFHLGRAKDALRDKLTDAGFDGEALDQQMKQALGQAHAGVIDQLSNAGNYEEAEAYFERHKGDFMRADAAAMQTALDEQNREYKNMARADNIWNDAGGDYGKALEEVRQVSDPRTRAALEARLAQLKTQDDAARSAKDQADLESGMGFVVTGRALPASWLRDASPLVVDRIQSEQRQRALWSRQMASATAEERAAMREISMGNYRQLKAQIISDPSLTTLGIDGLLADPYMADLWETMAPDEKGQFVLDMANATSRGGAQADATTKAYKEVMALVATNLPEGLSPSKFESQFKAAGEGTPGDPFVSRNRKKSKSAIELEGEVMRLTEEELQRTGGAAITADRAKQILALGYAAVGEKRDGTTRYPIPSTIAQGIMSEDAQAQVMSYRRNNPSLWRMTAERVRSVYPNASDSVIMEEAQRIEAEMAWSPVIGGVRQAVQSLTGPTGSEDE